MIAPLRPGVTPAQAKDPVIETERLRLRQWQGSDMAPYTAMLSDPGTARFITVDGKPVVDEMTGWRHTVVMAGHWVVIAKEFRGKGYAVEAARASINWSFATYDIDAIVHCIDHENIASQGVARRLGAKKDREIELFGHVADLWVTNRATWKG